MADGIDFKDLQRRMDGAMSAFRHDLASLRTGRASANLLDAVSVSAYGSATPINQVATITVPEARMLMVQVWDRGLATAVDRAIRESGLGLNPITEGATLRIPLPELNEERRKSLVKLAHQYAESARVAARHVRRDANDALKKAEKDGVINEDDMRKQTDRVQKITDTTISDIDKALQEKEAEIMHV
ncbi:MAG: ribosome recycling factor [Rhizobiaceae bacterium]|jgi:ribosome recycling factor|nr:ribosome recycling factor [Rhizobiaceae bacterium]